MQKDISHRLQGLEDIVHGIKTNQELLEYMTINLHKAPINLFNNVGLSWVWRSIMSIQLIDYYKVIKDDEKFSFQKSLNIMKNNGGKIDFASFEKTLTSLKKKYQTHRYEAVRSKYLAHQDLNVPEIRTSILEMRKFSKQIIDLFKKISKAIGYKVTPFSKEPLSSFEKIFDTIDEYERMKAFLMVKEIKGFKSVTIKALAEAIKN